MKLVVLLWFALAVNYVDRQIPYSILPALQADLGFTGARLGLVGVVFAWVYTLSMPVAGRVADLWRRDRMVVASLALFSVATLGCGTAQSAGGFLAWRAVLGVTESIYYPAAVGMIATFYPAAVRSRALGIHQSAQFAGLVAGGWYGGWMADHVSWRAGFMVASAVGLLYAGFLALTLPRPTTLDSVPPQPLSRALASLGRSRCYLALCAAFCAFCAMLWVFYAWYPLFLYERYRLSMTDSGFNATIFVQAACGAGVLVGGALGDRLSRTHPPARFYVVAAGILLSAPFGYLTFAADSLANARLCSCAYGFFAGLFIANVFAAAMEVSERSNYSASAGLLNTVGGVSSAIIIYVAGAVRESLGFAGLLQWVAVICCLGGVLVAMVAARRFAAEAT